MTLEEKLNTFYNKITYEEDKQTFKHVVNWIKEEYPELELVYKWNQPMFLEDGKFIIGLNIAKPHFSVASEYTPMRKFENKAHELGFKTTMMFVKILWTDVIPYDFLKKSLIIREK
ncbi:iron chaperone [Phocicoccus pinnipedialis]|uniref:YdhG-like domain-containing protein n=1 Tax=Phocicoccus pinnipedialis TaxID=110845 RepID=A0A6V7R4V8_9BACL|nr:DUF1801 domain-containing protein [Jeotgalicoccus pinnipedialis]CAD2072411.1 hypothetical protein JEOPIN946_00504 [Jeotgalicoccus pinnipedialis]